MKNSGVTLIELLIVIAIFGIITGIAIPGWIGYRSNSKLTGATTQLKANLEKAKLIAIRNSDLVAVIFENDGSGYRAFLDNGAISGNWVQEADESRITDVQFDPGITSNNNLNLNRIRFDGRGLPAPDPAAGTENIVSIIARTGTNNVTINRLGRVQIHW